MMKTTHLLLLAFLIISHAALSQTAMGNIYGRKKTSLNGKWQVIIDPNDDGKSYGNGGIGKDAKPKGKTDFLEYSFDGSPTLNVPGDFNSQMPELTYYESTVWYKKHLLTIKQINVYSFISVQ